MLTPNTTSQTCWQREISHVMNGIIFCFFNISHISSTNCLEVMSKRTQEDAGEERVTAKSKPMMNLVSRCSVRDPNVLASTASEGPGKPNRKVRTYLWARGMSSKQEQGDLWWALAHQTTQNGILTKSDLLKSGNLMKCWKQERERPVSGQPAGSFTQHTDRFVIGDDDMDSNTATESDLSLSHGHHSCTGSMIECERYWTNLQKMQCNTVSNIL